MGENLKPGGRVLPSDSGGARRDAIAPVDDAIADAASADALANEAAVAAGTEALDAGALMRGVAKLGVAASGAEATDDDGSNGCRGADGRSEAVRDCAPTRITPSMPMTMRDGLFGDCVMHGMRTQRLM